MSQCCLTTCKYADNLILALPATATAAIGVGFSYLEAKENVVASTLGAIGNRIFSVLTVVAGTVLLAWNLAKVIFAHLLNMATLGYVKPLKDFINFTEMELSASTAAVILLTISSLFGKTVIDSISAGSAFLNNCSEALQSIMGEDGLDFFPQLITNFSEHGIQGIMDRLSAEGESPNDSSLQTDELDDAQVEQREINHDVSSDTEVEERSEHTETTDSSCIAVLERDSEGRVEGIEISVSSSTDSSPMERALEIANSIQDNSAKNDCLIAVARAVASNPTNDDSAESQSRTDDTSAEPTDSSVEEAPRSRLIPASESNGQINGSFYDGQGY